MTQQIENNTRLREVAEMLAQERGQSVEEFVRLGVSQYERFVLRHLCDAHLKSVEMESGRDDDKSSGGAATCRAHEDVTKRHTNGESPNDSSRRLNCS